MEIVISAAVSVDGFMADESGNTDWVEDWDLFEKTSKAYGCTVMGMRTFEEGGSTFENCQHIVLTTQTAESNKNIHFVDSVEGAVQRAEQLGFGRLLVIGGAKTNESFLRAGKVQELLLDVHPLILGSGKKLFNAFDKALKLELIQLKEYPNFTHIRYKIIS